ncbi:hypothetical protein GCM10011386_40050 [Parapedobacter defluvii]|uniref:Carbohydrate-binding domain-containing protein n=1 Tax=Parapedobacter defluvii TaxID=2045106 RepID=A0ABQ1MN78_9SPHI|nr:carbohydrate-binding family 9-like protein [Parapedobacter defluvii]GGC43718.1 hypothetical protein GCM10011386_40050 [Parapedobacter defluvii]
MKHLIVPYLGQVGYGSEPDELWAAMANVSDHGLEEVSWPSFPYKPNVRFKLAYAKDCLLLCYVVREKHVRAVYRNTNDPVYKDSCVEFFLSFDAHQYYNLEFNCAGTGLIGYGGADKETRQRLPNDLIERVRTLGGISGKNDEKEEMEWKLLLNIPFEIFNYHTLTSFAGLRCTGNFYKCGDELPIPHFLSWNRIDHPVPNFHLPQFFGELLFQ